MNNHCINSYINSTLVSHHLAWKLIMHGKIEDEDCEGQIEMYSVQAFAFPVLHNDLELDALILNLLSCMLGQGCLFCLRYTEGCHGEGGIKVF